jgi:putative phage-type endonuclease
MNYVLRNDLIQGSAEWHEWRKGKIGASSVAPIMGLSPYTTKLQCWETFKFGLVKEKTAAMQRGNDLEESARIALNAYLDPNVNFEPVCVESCMYPWLIASLDGVTFDKDGNVHLACEIKCPGKRDHEIALNGFVPQHYYPQLQHIMCILGLPMMIYWSFDGVKGTPVWIERDDEFIGRMLKEEVAFMESLRDFMPPEPCDKDWVEDTNSARVFAAKRYRELLNRQDEIEEEKMTLKSVLTSVPHPRAMIGGLKVQKVRRKGNVDYGMIEALKTIDLEEYRKPASESWRIF